jgi:hypothetical protein
MTSFWYLFTSPAFLGPLKREKPPPWISLSFVSLSGLVKAHNPSKVTISENQKTQKSNSLQPKKFFRSPVSTTTQAFFLFSLLCGQPLITATTLPLPTAAPPCATTVLTVGQFPFSPDFLCYFLSELNSLHNNCLHKLKIPPTAPPLASNTMDHNRLGKTRKQSRNLPPSSSAAKASPRLHPRRTPKYHIPVKSLELQNESCFSFADTAADVNPAPQFALINEIYEYSFPTDLRTALLFRRYPDHDCQPAAKSILLHGILASENPVHAREVLQHIIDRLQKANIHVHPTSKLFNGIPFQAIQHQTTGSAIIHGSVGSTTKFLSLILDLEVPHDIQESTIPKDATLPRSLHFRESTIKKENSLGRQIDLKTTFSMTPQYMVNTKEMWMKTIDGTAAEDSHFRPVLSVTWLHPALDFLTAPIMTAMSLIFRSVLEAEELDYLVRNILIHPSRPFFPMDSTTDHLTGKGLTIWMKINVRQSLHTNTRRKLLATLLGDPKAHRATGHILGTKVIYYQPHPHHLSEPTRLLLGDLPPGFLDNDSWFVEMDNLPSACDTHSLYLIMRYGFGFGPRDILNVVHEYDQLDAKEAMTIRNTPRTVLLVDSASIVRTFLAHRTLITQGISRMYSHLPGVEEALGRPETAIRIRTRNTADHRSLPQLTDSPQMRLLLPIAISHEELATMHRSPTALPATSRPTALWNGTPPGLAPALSPPPASLSHSVDTDDSAPTHNAWAADLSRRAHSLSLQQSPPRSPSAARDRSASPRKRERHQDTVSPPQESSPESAPLPLVNQDNLPAVLLRLHNLAASDSSGDILDELLHWGIGLTTQALHENLLRVDTATEFLALAHQMRPPGEPDFQKVDSTMDISDSGVAK